MGAAIGQSLPLAVGVLVSPLPIVAVVLMLVSERARSNALAFVAGWFLAVLAVVGVVALVAGSAVSDDDGPAAWTGWLKLVLGVLLLLLAVRQWRARPRGATEPPPPRWMAAIDRFTPPRSAGLGVLLGAVNPKNLLLVVSGGTAIAAADPGDTGATALAALVFALVASAGVVAPVVLYFATGDRAAGVLDELRSWMVRNNAAIMAVLLLVLATKMLGDGISVL
ncbi:GAP family protein [Promicromonospora iranensis]|uniref:Threonine/homoserine/homoserine lactone efflux protein n=1 Tax=Promicromonospora iranensis TaxID=1105144 RepID=A0ABU2CUH2_9MICO|nr:GAP family protein [Promicromonospora iranensis]MDR7384995.1 threonine/homoserine/homoserine lactone efflux protein [Promicromonospora iranensis]